MTKANNKNSFPRREDDVIALAYKIAVGLEENPELFPSPPLKPADLKKMLDEFERQSDKAMAAHATAIEETK